MDAWSADDDEALRLLYPEAASCDALLPRFPGRTRNALYLRARKLGLLRNIHAKLDKEPPSELTRAYTAGLVDGEGSIQINASRGRAKGTAYWSLTVQVTSSVAGFFEELRSEWSDIGSITSWKPRGKREWRRSYNWRIYAAQAEWFLVAILPWLRLKHEQAQVAIEFREFIGAKGAYGLTAEKIERRQQLALQMQSLNARNGKAILTRTKSIAL